MMLLVLFFSCMVTGSFACNDDHCKDPNLAYELMEMKFLPNKQQLAILCPKVITFLECEKEFFECPGQTLEEMAVSPVKEEEVKGKAMLGGMSIVRDICDEDSSFHQDYIESVGCFREYVEVSARKCRQGIAKPIEEFFDQLYPTEDEASDEIYAEIRCLSDLLEIGCLVDNLGDSCGSVAQNVAMAVLERMKAPIKAGSCDNVENAADLKAKFMDFLDFDEPKRNRVQGVFDLLKKRR